MNLFSTVLSAMLWNKIGKASGENSRSSLTTGASTLIQASCTVGDSIHAGTDLEDKQQRLSIQVTTKLSNMNIYV